MLTWFNVVRFLGVALIVTTCGGLAIRVIAQEFRDMSRRTGMIEAAANVRRWADKHGYTIMFQQQVRESSALDKGSAQIVFRVVLLDQRGETKWAWILSGSQFEVRWIKPESWFVFSSVGSSSPEVEPLWHRELDA